MDSYNPVSRIAIIGAGPTGLAFAKYLLAENHFGTIDIFEQRDRVGGIWNFTSAERSNRIPIPQRDPKYGSAHQHASQNGSPINGTSPGGANNDSLEFESPLYDTLEANIPKEMMQFSDTPFPDHNPLYPNHQECLKYVERYAVDVRHLIKFQTQIQNVKLVNESSRSSHDRWEVVLKDLRDGTTTQHIYDAVVVASGHYTIPEIPEVDGMTEWNSAYPGSIIHSKAYRNPEPYKDKRVIVVGNSASGVDIASQIASTASQLYLSSRSESMFNTAETSWKEDIDQIIEYLPPNQYNRAIKTKSGRIVTDIDAIVYATGYFYSFPFLSELDPPLVTNGLRTRETYQHLFYIPHPTLVLPVLNIKIIPFALAENQAAVVARIWSGRLPTPTTATMRDWETRELESNGSGKDFHLKKFPGQAAQLNELYEWALAATPRSGLENDGVGKLGQHYDRRMVWLRLKMFELKMAYAAKGSERRKIRDVGELGFSYEEWLKTTAKPEDMIMFKEAQCLE